MKRTLLFSLIWVAGAVGAVAQDRPAPKSEFVVALSTPALEIKAGESRDVTVYLDRSKGFAKSKGVLGVSSGLPDGVTVVFEPATDVANEGVAKISVSKTTKPGNYTLILNGTVQHKTKGTMLTLTVSEGEAGTAVSSLH